MSWQATTWALEQDVATPSEMVTLMAICNYADFDGKCWPSQELLARQTKQSVDSVQRRLKDLERRGLIYRPSQRRKKDGRNSGEWTTGLIIVLVDDICRREALRHGFDPEELAREQAVSADAPASESEGQANQSLSGDAAPQSAARQNDEANEISGLYEALGGRRTADCGTAEGDDGTAICGTSGAAICGPSRTALVRHGIVKDEYTSPQSPPKPSSSPALDEGSWLSDANRFEGLWPWTGTEARDRVKRKFRELTPETRADVLHAAEAYLADRRLRNERICSARAFIADGIFKNWTKAGRELAAKGGDRQIGEQVFVHLKSPAGEAWLAHDRAAGKKSSFSFFSKVHNSNGFYRPTLFPPRSSQAAAPSAPGPEPPLSISF